MVRVSQIKLFVQLHSKTLVTGYSPILKTNINKKKHLKDYSIYYVTPQTLTFLALDYTGFVEQSKEYGPH